MKLLNTEYVADRIPGLRDFRKSRKYLCAENNFSAYVMAVLRAFEVFLGSAAVFSKPGFSNSNPTKISRKVANASSDEEITCATKRIKTQKKRNEINKSKTPCRKHSNSMYKSSN